MKTFTLVHNIPSPFRLFLFRLLGEQLKARGIHFHVHFMAHTRPDRSHWRVTADSLSFAHTFWPDVGLTLRGQHWHFNPHLVAALARMKTDYLMMGGLWDSLTGMLVTTLAKRRVGIGWLEGNTQTPGRVGGAARLLKRYLLARCNYLAVPGQQGVAYVNLFFKNGGAPPTAILPNIVDERTFIAARRQGQAERNRVRSELGVRPKRLLAVWPARLIPEKGISEFLALLDEGMLDSWQVVILGEGPLKEGIETVIASKQLEDHVRLVQFFPYDKMPLVYAAADLFLLPSLSDPNPMSVIEALHSGLPILISDRLGNYAEALRPGVNGWGFSPADEEGAMAAARAAFGAPPAALRRMGERSTAIAAEYWTSARAVENFLNSIKVL